MPTLRMARSGQGARFLRVRGRDDDAREREVPDREALREREVERR